MHTPALILKSAAARKTSPNAQGLIAYQILSDADRKAIFLRIVQNEGGGYVSHEAVELAKVIACIQDAEGKPIPAKAFMPAFKSKSVNNGGFLCAVLRAEGLLGPVPDSMHQHLLAGDWGAWQSEMLALPGEPYVPATETKADSATASLSHSEEVERPAKGKRKGARQSDEPHHHPTVEDGHDASPAQSL